MTGRRQWCLLLLFAGMATRSTLAAPRDPPRDGWLRERFSQPSSARLLEADEEGARQRGIERLARVPGAYSARQLSGCLASSRCASSPRLRLAVVRSVARRASEARIFEALARVVRQPVTAHKKKGDRASHLTSATAALALAAYGGQRGRALLADALRERGPLAELAKAAFLAHPPTDWRPLLLALGPWTPAVVELLDRLEPPGARRALRRILIEGPDEASASAARALVRCGDPEVGEVALHWLATSDRPVLREAALGVLAESRDERWTESASQALRDPDAKQSVLRLLVQFGIPEQATLDLPPGQWQRFASASPLERRLLPALARHGNDDAVHKIARWFADEGRAPLAAEALAHSSSAAAQGVLDEATRHAQARDWPRLAVTLRLWLQRRSAPTWLALAERELHSSRARTRAWATWTLSLLQPGRTRLFVQSDDPITVLAAASTLLVAPPAARRAAAERLNTVKARQLSAALGLTLVDPVAAARVTSRTLRRLVDSKSEAAGLALFHLAARSRVSSDALGHALMPLPSSPESWRCSWLVGLGNSGKGSAVASLEQAYARETSDVLRACSIQGLAKLSRSTPWQTLRLAGALDPADEVRAWALGSKPPPAPLLVTVQRSASWWALPPRAPRAPVETASDGLVVLASETGLPLPAAPFTPRTLVLVGLEAEAGTVLGAAQ